MCFAFRRQTFSWKHVLCGFAMSVAIGCNVAQPDFDIALSDKILGAAQSLQFSQQTQAVVRYQLDANVPWFLVFVPGTGIEPSTVADMPEDARQQVIQRLQSWSGRSVLVDARPRAISITKLPEEVRLAKAIKLRGEVGVSVITVTLMRAGDSIALDSVTRQ